MDHAFAFIFTSRAAYEDFFALIATEARSVSLLRRRAYVLDEAMDVETAGDNLARILRRARSLRLSDFEDTLPTLKSPPARCRKRLSVCVSTFNRAQWLLATLPLLAEETRGRGDIELLIVDNTSTDETPFVIGEIVERYGIRLVRNPSNVGMLGNLAVTAVNAEGDYVWILGDDDIVVPGTIEKIMRMLQEFPSSELIYLNYAYTHFDRPVDLTDSTTLIAGATPIAPMTPNGYFDRIRDFAANNENLFTAIYACVFRRDHAIAAYTQYTGGMPFSTMAACIPTTKYVLEQMMDRPGCWIGSHQLVVNMNVSWMRYAAVWHMERLPEAFDLAEREGADPTKLMKYRRSNLTQAVHFMRQGYTEDQDIRGMLSFARYLENAKRIPDLPRHAAELFLEYDMATAAQSKDEGLATTGSLRTMYGLLDQ